MHDTSEDEFDEDEWSEYDPEEYAPKTHNDEYVDELGQKIFSLLDAAFPGQVQFGDVMFQPGNYTFHEDFANEAEEQDFAAKAFPLLKQEIVRQANGLGGVPGDWTARFDVDGSTVRQRGASTTPYASVSVLVFEGPLDPDIS